MIFRQDINGLRAIAVIAVVLYHFGITGFAGGFSGVDIFFVISGYLMTGIIFSKIEKNRFNLLDFYLARAARIIPALAVLCVTLLVVAWFILPPYEMRSFGKHILGAATFLSNFIFARDSGYFDGAADEKWLLHTWSLSVEWQFYIFYPLLILAIRKYFSFNVTRWTLVFFAVASYLLSIFFPARLADAGFYLLPTRAWEMIAGGLIYAFSLQASQKYKLTLEGVGLILLAGSILLLNSSYAWPGSLAALPVLGAALVIIAANEKSPFTHNPVSQYIGTISYSLYLWHWPVVVVLNLFELKESAWGITAGIAASLLLAMLSYYLVERPWRNAFPTKLPQIFPVLGYTSLTGVIAVAGLGIFYFNGVPSRVDELVVIADSEQNNRNPRSECFVIPSKDPTSPMCVFGEDKDKIGLIVIGDSHSNATITAVAAAIPQQMGGVLFLGADGCAAMMNLSTPHFYNCGDYNKKVLHFLQNNLPGSPVLVINHITQNLLTPPADAHKKPVYLAKVPNTSTEFAELFKQEYQSHLCKLTEHRPVYVMQSIPGMNVNVPQAIVRSMMYKSEKVDIAIPLDEYYKREQPLRTFMSSAIKACNAHELDPLDYLCRDNACIGSINYRPLYYDDDHLSEYGNRLLIPMFRNIWPSTEAPAPTLGKN
ncbi:MAG TPA: acyltransferase family protein [Cellvibrio sp.]|nr:acyltransferase family protein [Cellvibrio sp.]